MKVEMTQLYLCEEPYWSKYDQNDLYDQPLEINVISDGNFEFQCLSSFFHIHFKKFPWLWCQIWIFSGITRLPVLEGEVSHVEIPRTSPSLGITIVGGADTPLVSILLQFTMPLPQMQWRDNTPGHWK